jgi:hypothetical protein
MPSLRALIRRPATVAITLLAVTDVAYRLLVRPTVRRGLGIKL